MLLQNKFVVDVNFRVMTFCVADLEVNGVFAVGQGNRPVVNGKSDRIDAFGRQSQLKISTWWSKVLPTADIVPDTGQRSDSQLFFVRNDQLRGREPHRLDLRFKTRDLSTRDDDGKPASDDAR